MLEPNHADLETIRFDFGDTVSWKVNVTDPEDATVDPQDVERPPFPLHHPAIQPSA